MIADKNDESRRRRYILHIFVGKQIRFMLSKIIVA